MQFTTAAFAMALFSAVGLTQETSGPFNLTVTSPNGKYEGAQLSACHTGAAIESICVGEGASTFNQNYTSSPASPASPGNGPLGQLTWFLPAEPSGESEPMYFYSDISTNLALPLFEPSDDYTPIAFDSNNLMNTVSALDDKVTPPTYQKNTAYYRWYVCESNFEGYVYETLNWLYGSGDPQNPSCIKVDVRREFI